MGRREQKREATREQMLAAAEALFTERGFEATTVDDIAERADVAKGTFYYHFKTKEDVAVAIARAAMRRGDPTLKEDLMRLPAIDALKRVCALGAPWVEEHKELARTCLIYALAQVLRGEAPPVGDEQSMRHVLGAILAAGQKRGEIRDDFPAEVMGQMIGALFFQVTLGWTMTPDPPPLREHVERFLDLVLDGIRRQE